MMERRATPATPELRAAEGEKVAAGYAALFNTTAEIGDLFIERIMPGAFAETLRSNDVIALVNHDPGRVIGRKSVGTLRLKEDAKGLAVEIDLPDTTDGRDLAEQLRRGDIGGMSFGFDVIRDEWDWSGAVPVRTLHEIRLGEVSAVAFPAYEDTTLALRSLEAARSERRQNNRDAAARRVARKAQAEARFRRIA